MAELKNMTVQALRDLARKALGRGHSRLKTKGELVAALQAAGKSVSGTAEKAAAKVKAATGRAVKEATGRATKVAEKVTGAAKSAKARTAAAKAAKVAKAAKAPAAAKKKAAAPAKAADRPRAAKEKPPVEEARRDEPDADGYFVARVRGEDAVRDAPHPMTESALEAQRGPEPRRAGARPGQLEEDLGELPWSYADDAFVALPRDPRTLFLYWDHHGETLKNGFAGLEGAHAQLWIFASQADGGWERVRTLDFALESRSWYVHDLDPGRVYRAEIHLVDRAGRDKVLSSTPTPMQLPPFGPSAIVADRFLRIPWGEPLRKLLAHVREGSPFPEELRALLAHLSDWSRFVGPAWGSGSGGPGDVGAGGPGGRPSGPSGAPTSPSSPWGPFGSGSGEGR